MSYSINLSAYGPEIKKAYDSVVSSDPSVTWAVFSYEAAASSSVLKPTAQGAGSLADFVEEFDDGKVQYGFARLEFNNVSKFVLVGWAGEGVPERAKGYFNAHYATVAKTLTGYHVQITARSPEDLSEQIIWKRVQDAAGSKYSSVSGTGRDSVPLRPKEGPASNRAEVPDDAWGDDGSSLGSEVKKVQTAYRPTQVDLASIRAKPVPVPPSAAKSSAPAAAAPSSVSSSKSSLDNAVGTAYQPVGKVDIAAIRAQAKGSRFSDDRPAPLQSSYQPIGKVDIAAIRAQAKSSPQYRESIESKPIKSDAPAPAPSAPSAPKAAPAPESSNGDDDERLGSVKDRMKAFGAPVYTPSASSSSSIKDRAAAFSDDSGRLSELPKPKVSNQVSSRFSAASSAGTGPVRGKPSLPQSPFTSEGSRAAAGFKNFGSENGKSPAQLWAEKHGKSAPAPAAPAQDEAPAAADEPEPEAETEETDIKSLRDKFAGSSVAQPDAAPAPSFSDITSQLARKNSPAQAEPLPARAEPEPPLPSQSEPEPPLPARDPEPIVLAQPVASEPEPEPVQEPELSAGAVAIAIYDYTKDEDNEIALADGERIINIEFVDTDWWQGENSKGEIGLFPAAYVEIQEAPETASAAAPAPAPEPVADPTPVATEAPEPVPEPAHEPVAGVPQLTTRPSAVAEYDYAASEEGELSFPEGAVITEIEFVDEAWWEGEYNGERNLFPANFVTLRE